MNYLTTIIFAPQARRVSKEAIFRDSVESSKPVRRECQKSYPAVGNCTRNRESVPGGLVPSYSPTIGICSMIIFVSGQIYLLQLSDVPGYQLR